LITGDHDETTTTAVARPLGSGTRDGTMMMHPMV